CPCARDGAAQARLPVPPGRERSAGTGRLGATPLGLLLCVAYERDGVQPDRRAPPDTPGQGVDGGRVDALGDHRSSGRRARREHSLVERHRPDSAAVAGASVLRLANLRSHNPEVAGSNPAPATSKRPAYAGLFISARRPAPPAPGRFPLFHSPTHSPRTR